MIDERVRVFHAASDGVYGAPRITADFRDSGTQYTSEQIHKVTKRLGVDQSMGRTGVCWDNAMAESFWSTLKNEFYHRFTWPTRAEAQKKPSPDGLKPSTTADAGTHPSATKPQ